MTNLSISVPKTSLNPKTALNKLSGLGDWVGLRIVHETTHYRASLDGKPEQNRVSFDRGAMIEVLINGHMAYAGTCDLTSTGIEKAALRAQALARAGHGYKIYDFSESLMRPKSTGTYTSPRKKDLSHKSLQEFSAELARASETMRVSDKISSSQAKATLVEAEYEYLTTNGTHTLQNFLLVSSHFGVIASEGTESQTRSLQGQRGACVQSGLEIFDTFGLKEDLRKVGEEAIQLLSAPNCPEKTCDLLLMPNQMLLQIHESIGHPLEMDRILGDERNFAGWSFVKAEDFGSLQYGSALMNITFAPDMEHEFASYKFDDGGAPATREFLIKEGRLIRGLGGLESQARMNRPGVANFRAASWNRAPIDRMANINLEPGTTSLSEMIKQMEDGIVMDANISWSIDDYRDKFQFGCEMGRLIKNGEIKGILKNPIYR
jgi:predicted Zn-dependent protease